MTDEATPNEAGLVPDRVAFEEWFLRRYYYSRAVLTNPIWASEIKAAAEAFEAGRAAERERCAQIADKHARRSFQWGSENADLYHAQADWAAAIAKSIRQTRA